MKENTLPALLLRNSRKYRNRKVALREKEFGIWQDVTWEAYYDHVKNFALGLLSLGFKRGDKLAIIGDNRPEWVYAELAAQSIGGIPLGIYQDSIKTEVAYVIDHSDATIIVAEDQEQTDKILDMMSDVPKVRHVIYSDDKGMHGYNSPYLLYFPDVEYKGKDYAQKYSKSIEQSINEISEDDVALIAYTSGTTGNPKGSLLSHRNLLRMAYNLNTVDPKYETDEFVSFLPLPWIGEQMMSVSSSLAFGFTVNFPEEPDTASNDLYEIGPNVMFSPPRVWEDLSRTVMVKHLDASSLKRLIYKCCMPVGYKVADFKFSKQPVPVLWKLAYWFSYMMLLRALKDRLGFSNLRSASTGGAALGPDVFRFFHALGVNLKQIYGQTEISGISCIHRDGDIDFDTVGKPLPETEIRITEDGEIISRNPSLFLGYYKDKENTEKTIIDGWLYSGDAGYFNEDGHLVCIDRVKDLMELEDGTKFSPMFIENKLKFCPYIVEAVALGHNLPNITAIICVDYKNTGKWLEDHHISYTTYTDLASKDKVYGLIEKEVQRVNRSLPEKARIKKFLLLYKELDPDDGELTRTKKLRRNFINEKYTTEIDAMYLDIESVPIESIITYQDGKTTTLRTNLKIRDMDVTEDYDTGRRRWWQIWK